MNGVAGSASAGTADRVRRAAEALDYRPVSAGRALRQKRSRLVALLAANLANPAMTAIATSIETALREKGLVMVLCDTHDRADLQDEYLQEMRAQLVRATILLGAVASPHLTKMLAAGEPVLFINRRCPDQGAHPYLGIDNVAAGRDVARFFLSHGIAVAGAIHGSLQSSATAERVRSFCAELAECGKPLSDGKVVTLDMLDHVQIGFRTAAALIQPNGRQALFCSSDLIAYGAHRALCEAGLRVPEDVVLVGFDDTPLNEWLAPWLTSVRVPYEEFGPAMAEMLESIWAGDLVKPRMLSHRLVARLNCPTACDG